MASDFIQNNKQRNDIGGGVERGSSEGRSDDEYSQYGESSQGGESGGNGNKRRSAIENIIADENQHNDDSEPPAESDSNDIYSSPSHYYHGDMIENKAPPTDKKKGSLSKYPIPNSFIEVSRDKSQCELDGVTPDNILSRNPNQSASNFKDEHQKKAMIANLNFQSDDEEDEYSERPDM